MENKTITIDAHAKFKHGFRWTLAGSITYEAFKIAHCLALLRIIPTTMYGLMGSLFSLIYLVTYIADFGATNSLAPHLTQITTDKKTFKRYIINLSLLLHTPLIIICAASATFFAATKLPSESMPYLWIIPLLIIFETTRNFLRVLLHMTFQAKRIVITEIIIFFSYLASIWIPYGIRGTINLNYIFIPHLIDSFISVIVFSLFVIKLHKTLPNPESVSPKHEQQLKTKKILTTRIFNYLLRLSRNMFTSNFLTPLFAIKFGLASAGLFYFASTLANGIQAIMKSIVGHSGGALLANVKNEGQAVKKEAFQLLCQKALMIIAPIITFVIINYNNIIKLNNLKDTASNTIALCLLFITISFSDFLFLLYEQFYIIEDAASKLFLLKLLELTCFYIIITSDIVSISPISTLIGLIIIRSVSFVIIAVNAFYLWKIKPNYNINIWYFTTCIILSLITALLWK